jgi:hypothetical protein
VYIGTPHAQDGETAWYLAKSEAPDVLQIPAASWRDPKLLRLPAEVITSITLTQPTGQIVLTRDNEHSPWSLDKPLKTRGSKERITELLSTLLNIEISEARDLATTTNGNTPKGDAQAQPADEISIIITSKPRDKSYAFTIKKPVDAKQPTTTATTAWRKSAFTVAAKNLASLWVSPTPCAIICSPKLTANACNSSPSPARPILTSICATREIPGTSSVMGNGIPPMESVSPVASTPSTATRSSSSPPTPLPISHLSASMIPSKPSLGPLHGKNP